MAEERRKEEIMRLDKIPRHYLYEGVYNFSGKTTRFKSYIDKFGQTITNSETVNLGEGEVSFKSEKNIKLFRGIREELIPVEVFQFHLFQHYFHPYSFYSKEKE